MAFSTPITYTSGSHYDTQFVLDVRRMRPVFQNFPPEVRTEIARALHAAYPDLLITSLPSGNLSIEKV